MNNNQITIGTDPRIELLGVIQYLSTYGENSHLAYVEKNNYTERVNEYFKEFTNHPVISLIEEMAINEFNYDAPVTLMLNLSNPPELKLQNELGNYLLQRSGSEEKLINLINEIRDFSLKANFIKFYNDNLDFYEEHRNKVNLKVIEQHIGFVVDYYRVKSSSNINIIFSLLTHQGNYGYKRENSNSNSTDDMNLILASDFLINAPSKAPFNYPLIWHELSHSYVNPLVDKHIDEFMKYDYLFEKFYNEKINSAYDKWIAIVCEYLVRAVTTRIGHFIIGNGVDQKLLELEKQSGFIYLELFTEKLKEFEENTDKYPSFNDFAFEIIDVFKKFSS